MPVQVSDNSYSLLVRVRSTGYSRLIDPSDSLLRLARGFKQESCKHGNRDKMQTFVSSQKGITYSFHDVLGRWKKWDHSLRFTGHNPIPDGEDEDETNDKGVL